MTGGLEHPLVANYLARLDEASMRVPAGRRGELISELRAHLHETLGAHQFTEDEIRTTLERLGDPEAIIAAELGPEAALSRVALANQPARADARRPWGVLEVIGVASLAASPLLGAIAIVAVLIGLTCVWISSAWRLRDKIIATALSLILYLGLIATLVVLRLGLVVSH